MVCRPLQVCVQSLDNFGQSWKLNLLQFSMIYSLWSLQTSAWLFFTSHRWRLFFLALCNLSPAARNLFRNILGMHFTPAALNLCFWRCRAGRGAEVNSLICFTFHPNTACHISSIDPCVDPWMLSGCQVNSSKAGNHLFIDFRKYFREVKK